MTSPIAAFKSEIILLFREGKDEIKNLFDFGLSDYLEDHFQKFSITNTFLFQHEKVNFYDVFFPLEIESTERGLDTFNRLHRINSAYLLNDLFGYSQYTAIIGYAGSGKTMLIKHLFLTCCNSNNQFKIPIYIELRSLNTFTGSLREYIYSVLTKNKIKPSSKILERALMKGHFMFLFDGYDELHPDLLEKITNDIELFLDEFNKNYFVLTSRPGSNVENLYRVIPYYVSSLNEDQILEFTEKQLIAANDIELIEKINSTINDPKNYDYKNYLTNPLLLSMFILTYSKYPELPKYKSKFYSNVIDTLATKHDSITKKGGFKHPRKSNLNNEDFENILKAFCFISFFEAKYDFEHDYLKERLKFIREKLGLNFNTDDVIYDLSVSLSIFLLDGLIYRFPHRTMQDYLTISFIKELDDKSKEKIYSEKCVRFFQKNLVVNISFVALCIEMDKQAFYKFFVKKIFNDFIELMDSKNFEEKLIQIMKYIIDNYEISKAIFHKLRIDNATQNLHLTYSLLYCLNFLEGKNTDFSFELQVKNKFPNLFKKTLLDEIKNSGYLDKNDNSKYLSIKSLPDDLILKFIQTYQLEQPLLGFLEVLKNKNDEVDNIIELDSNNLNSIWNFSSKA